MKLRLPLSPNILNCEYLSNSPTLDKLCDLFLKNFSNVSFLRSVCAESAPYLCSLNENLTDFF